MANQGQTGQSGERGSSGAAQGAMGGTRRPNEPERMSEGGQKAGQQPRSGSQESGGASRDPALETPPGAVRPTPVAAWPA